MATRLQLRQQQHAQKLSYQNRHFTSFAGHVSKPGTVAESFRAFARVFTQGGILDGLVRLGQVATKVMPILPLKTALPIAIPQPPSSPASPEALPLSTPSFVAPSSFVSYKTLGPVPVRLTIDMAPMELPPVMASQPLVFRGITGTGSFETRHYLTSTIPAAASLLGEVNIEELDLINVEVTIVCTVILLATYLLSLLPLSTNTLRARMNARPCHGTLLYASFIRKACLPYI